MSSTLASEKLTTTIKNLVHNRGGVLTRDLLRTPGNFGLGQAPARLAPDATTNMICGYCSTGCSLKIHLQAGEAVNLTPTTEYPVNLGMACPKGWEALNVLDSPERATTPLLRNREGELERVSWDRALEVFCVRFQSLLEQFGPESVAFLSTGQMPTEEMALLGSLTKFGMGMLHGDGNTRQCMATAAVAYKQSFGFDAPPYTYQDFEESDVIVLAGSNLCIAHPIMWERVCRNPHDPKIIVIDPRRTETAMSATEHLAIAPKGDLALFYAVAHVLLQEGWVDHAFIEAHTNGFADFAEFLADYQPVLVAEKAGVSVDTIERLARTIHEGKRVSFWWTMGVNQSYEGVRVAQSIINLALMTGNIGRPGTGANSITGQANAMGSRIFSNTTSLLGGRDFTNPDHRREVAQTLDIPIENIPSKNSLPYHKILEGVRSGTIRGLWVICTNPAHSWIHKTETRELLDQLDFLVVQDMYSTTETARQADLMLPAAGWGEKEGTFINSERRLGVLKRVKRAPGEALADFSIFKLIAEYWGCGDMFDQWESPTAVFQILKQLSAGRPCDFSGIEDYAEIDRLGGVQWPCPEPAHEMQQQRRLFEDGKFFHPDGHARFVFEATRDMPESVDHDYPLMLMTGRGSVSQWHTQTRTSQSAVLSKLHPKNIYVELNPRDAKALEVQSHELVRVVSRRGELEANVFLTSTVQPGQAFVPMHYEATNRLTLPHFDPYSHQPSFKNCAVRIERILPSWADRRD